MIAIRSGLVKQGETPNKPIWIAPRTLKGLLLRGYVKEEPEHIPGKLYELTKEGVKFLKRKGR